jgi:hypothetical protein
MSDKELVKRLADWSEHDEGKINDARQEAADRIEGLNEQLEQLVAINEAARADAKEAEAYADELAKDQVDLCRQLIAAENKLAKLVRTMREAVIAWEQPHYGDMETAVDHGSEAIDLLRAALAEIESSEAVTPYGLGEKT